MTMIERMESLHARVAELESRCSRCGFGHKVCMCMRHLEEAVKRITALEERAVMREAPEVELNERGHYVVPGVVDVDNKLEELAKGGRLIDRLESAVTPEEMKAARDYRDHVEALVKAAQTACTYWLGGPDGDADVDESVMDKKVCAIVDSLKPFEVA